MLSRLITITLLSICVFISNANADQGVSANEILLGEVEPLTGAPALLGIAYNVGTKIAIAEANAVGGIEGRKMRLITEDDGYVPARTIQAAKKLIEVDKIFAFTSLSGSGQALTVLPLIAKAGIPAMPAIAPVTGLYHPPQKNVFVVGQSYEEGMYQLARYLATKFPGKKWGILTQDDDYGLTLRTGFAKAKKEFNLNVVYEGEYKKGQQDFSSEMLRVRSASAEIFLAGGVIAESVAMVKELEKLNHKPTIGMFWPGRIPATLKLMGPASEGIYAVDYVDPDNSETVAVFTERAKKFVGEAEIKAMNRYTLAGYTSTRILIEAMKRCGKTLTWACTIAELEKTKNFDSGVMGPVSFGPGVRFSSQSVRIMRADHATLSFKPVQ
jgi:branched-chain amino acid transport system substrate-binding protein